MPIALICTGTELLKGGCCNTNMFFAGSKLSDAALPPVMELSIGDHQEELYFAISSALKMADTLIISGGLGPTRDDITLETVSRFFGLPLIEVPELKEKVKKCWELRHTGHCPKFQYKQAKIIETGRYFDNPAGVASGIAFDTNYGGAMRHIYLLPGPPAEFETVFTNGVLPEIISVSGKKSYTAGFLICGTGEVTVAKTVEPLLSGRPIEIAYTAVPGGTKLFLSGCDKNILDQSIQEARQAFGPCALPSGCTALPPALLGKLKEKKLSLGCAESCTGGLIADSIVSLPGASDVFQGGIVSYANSVKNSLLNVSDSILENYGAVSAECASAMANGAAKILRCDCAISTTGIAGPDGGSAEKPVGLVFIAAAVKDKTKVRELHLRGNRQMIRERAAAAACQLLWELLNDAE